jgi:hypothetical protein
MEETMKDKESSLEYCLVLKKFEDVFEEFPGFPRKRDIDFSIDLKHRATPISNNPYRMSMPELKKLKT